MRSWLGIAVICAIVFSSAAQCEPEGYVSTEKLASELNVERLAMRVKGKTAPTMVLLRSWNHSIAVLSGVDYIKVNRQAWTLSKPVVAAKSDLLVPLALRTRLAKLLGVRLPEPVAPRPRPAAKGYVVVIDPGHGGKDPGAIGRRLRLKEKVVVLDVSKRLARLLRAQGVNVVMTRSTDVFITLDNRVETANRHRPNLYVSIHADAAVNRQAHGSTVFYPDDKIGGGKADITYRALLHKRSTSVSPAQVGSPGRFSENVEGAIFGTMLQEYRLRSWAAAKHILRGLGSAANTLGRGARPACYRVVRYPRCPSVLVELEFLSNPDGEKRLSRSDFRERLAQGLAKGILSYLATVPKTFGGPKG